MGMKGDISKEFTDNAQRIGNNRTTLTIEDNLSGQSIEINRRVRRARSREGSRSQKATRRSGGGLH